MRGCGGYWGPWENFGRAPRGSLVGFWGGSSGVLRVPGRSWRRYWGPKGILEKIFGCRGDFGGYWGPGMDLGAQEGDQMWVSPPPPNVGPPAPSCPFPPAQGGPKSGPDWPHHPPLPRPLPETPKWGRGAPLTCRELEATEARLGSRGDLTWGGVARLAPTPPPGCDWPPPPKKTPRRFGVGEGKFSLLTITERGRGARGGVGGHLEERPMTGGHVGGHIR